MPDRPFDITPFLSQDEGQHGFRVSHEGTELIVFDVPAADVPVQMTGNGFPLRVGDRTVRARESLISASKQQGMHESWESRRSPCTPLLCRRASSRNRTMAP